MERRRKGTPDLRKKGNMKRTPITKTGAERLRAEAVHLKQVMRQLAFLTGGDSEGRKRYLVLSSFSILPETVKETEGSLDEQPLR